MKRLIVTSDENGNVVIPFVDETMELTKKIIDETRSKIDGPEWIVNICAEYNKHNADNESTVVFDIDQNDFDEVIEFTLIGQELTGGHHLSINPTDYEMTYEMVLPQIRKTTWRRWVIDIDFTLE